MLRFPVVRTEKTNKIVLKKIAFFVLIQAAEY